MMDLTWKDPSLIQIAYRYRLQIILAEMGNTNPLHVQLIGPALDNYLTDSPTPTPKLLKHKLTKQRIEQHPISLKSREQLNRQIHIYEFRKYSPNVVRCPYMTINHENPTHNGSFSATLYVESIPVRLSQIKDIPYPDMLHLLEAALRGFSVLYERIGYFRIEEEMVCVGYDSKVKVWVHPRLEKTAPNQHEIDYGGQEEDMVEKILKISEANTYCSKEFETFPMYCRKKDQRGFDETIAKLYKYAKGKNIAIPPKLSCASLLIEKIANGEHKKTNKKIPCGSLLKGLRLKTESKSKQKNSSPGSIIIRNQPTTPNSSGNSTSNTHTRRLTQALPSKLPQKPHAPTPQPSKSSKRNPILHQTKTTSTLSAQRPKPSPHPPPHKTPSPYFNPQTSSRLPRIIINKPPTRTQTPESVIFSNSASIRVKFSYSNSPSSSVGSIKNKGGKRQ